MQVPLQINFQGMTSSEAMEGRVRECVARLEKLTDRIISCRVTLEAPHKQSHRSNVAIAVNLNVPGKEIVVKREQRRHETRSDAYQVIRIAFDIVARKLDEYMRISRHDVKAHEGATYARIVKLYPEQNYGFIETPVQLNVYFHGSTLAGCDMSGLEVGSEVLYTLATDEGPMGPQASKVQVVGGQHPVR